MSTQSKGHAAKADQYNKQASEFIFRENNAVGKVAGDTIDLHGQFVEEVSTWSTLGMNKVEWIAYVESPSTDQSGCR